MVPTRLRRWLQWVSCSIQSFFFRSVTFPGPLRFTLHRDQCPGWACAAGKRGNIACHPSVLHFSKSFFFRFSFFSIFRLKYRPMIILCMNHFFVLHALSNVQSYPPFLRSFTRPWVPKKVSCLTKNFTLFMFWYFICHVILLNQTNTCLSP